MYYLVYGFLYLISLLPFFMLYFLSDLVYLLLYVVIGYRKKVVMDNLALAFPEKSLGERKRIAVQFYKNFVDTFIETIKLLSMRDREFDKRCTGDFSLINQAAAKGKNIQLMGGHQFNWEFTNLLFSRHINIPFIGVVANVENKIFNRIYFKFRARYGTILIPNSSFQRQMIELMKSQYSLCLLADQNTHPGKAYWLNFFGKPVPFIMGPHRAAVKSKPMLVYFDFKKIKRGHYHFEVFEIIENPGSFTPEALALKYRDYLESVIRKQPANYLWSHRRWKHEYHDSYEKQWIDN
ncbi:MAG: lipid A biosynthesis acyltransferase [Ferruginibacter sp.]|nr:lipid A biosynthesis acyltransferase [Ferruginibacter sp.]